MPRRVADRVRNVTFVVATSYLFTGRNNTLMSSRTCLLALALAAATPSIGSAVDFSYNGFSTAAYSQTDTDKAQVGFSGQPEGIDSGGTTGFDSKLGVQVTAKFNDVFSATLQGVAYTDLTGEWEPHLDWAYVRAQVLPSLSARVGLLRTPMFMFSDSVFIGYSNVWLRAPLEIYNQSPAYQLRGADLNWRGSIGPVAVGLQPYFGESSVDSVFRDELTGTRTPSTLHATGWTGLVATAEYGSLSLRAAYSRMKLEDDIAAVQPLIDTLESIPAAFCPGCADVARQMHFDGTRYRALSLGAQYNDGANVAIAEFAKRVDNGNIVSADMHGAYVTYGRQFGNLMPYVTTAIHRVDSPLTSDAIPAVGPLAALAAGVNQTIGNSTDQDSYSIGVRYELPGFSVVKGALLKVQYDRIEIDAGPGNLNFVQPDFDGSVDMIGMSVDFIF